MDEKQALRFEVERAREAKLPNLIAIQQEFIDTVNAGHSRWQHRRGFEWQRDKIGGHYGRIYRGRQQS